MGRKFTEAKEKCGIPNNNNDKKRLKNDIKNFCRIVRQKIL